MSVTLMIITVFFASALVCLLMAKKLDGSPVFWAIMGLLFGPFAIMLLAYLSKKLHNNYKI